MKDSESERERERKTNLPRSGDKKEKTSLVTVALFLSASWRIICSRQKAFWVTFTADLLNSG